MEPISEPLAVVLGVVDTGYSIIRSLSQDNIRIVGVEKTRGKPEVYTRLCSNILHYRSESDLLNILLNLAAKEEQKPILFLSSDPLVEFCKEHHGVLKNYYDIDFPDARLVSMLLEKDKFCEMAENEGFLIPKTYFLKKREDFIEAVNKVRYPCIVKPVWRKEAWTKGNLEKVYYLTSREELERKYSLVASFESNLLLQEFIPGPDKNVYFSLVYVGASGKCLVSFSGRKIRQWKPALGSTSSAMPVYHFPMEEMTRQFFERLNYKGFGSLEFKQSAHDGKFYVIEPTVGRPDHQSFIATANGINMPLVSYRSLAGLGYDDISKKFTEQRLWVDEQYELGSLIYLLRRRQISIAEWLGSLNGKRAYRFMNLKDPLPALLCIFSSLRYLIRVLNGTRSI